MRLARLYGALFSMSLRRQMTFRADLVFELAATLVSLGASLSAVLVLFTRTDRIGGYTATEVVTVLGTFHMITGLRRAAVEPNLRFNSSQVRDGSFDGLLLQPAPTIFLASLGTVAPLALAQSALGLCAVAIAVPNLPNMVDGAEVAGWLVMFVSGAAVMWATRCLNASVVFWKVGLQLDVVYDGVWQVGPYPTNIFAQPVRFMLTYIIPTAFIATFPAAVLTGHLAPIWSVSGPIAVLVFVPLAVFVWQRGLANYSSATS